MEERIMKARIARKLNEILGKDYKVNYDACESGLTDIYYKGILFKSVSNSEIKPDLNVIDFRVNYIWLQQHNMLYM